jgi:hypothetical protein
MSHAEPAAGRPVRGAPLARGEAAVQALNR